MKRGRGPLINFLTIADGAGRGAFLNSNQGFLWLSKFAIIRSQRDFVQISEAPFLRLPGDRNWPRLIERKRERKGARKNGRPIV
jgi:hypothetical protein